MSTLKEINDGLGRIADENILIASLQSKIDKLQKLVDDIYKELDRGDIFEGRMGLGEYGIDDELEKRIKEARSK